MNFNSRVLTFREYYPNSKITDRILRPSFQLLIYKNRNNKFLFENIL